MPFQFDAKGAAQAIANDIASRVTDITAQTQKAIRTKIVKGFKNKTNPDLLIREIKDIVGLTEAQMQAVETYRETLTELGTAPGKVQSMTARYSARKLRERSETIARTEVVTVLNRGADLAWQQAIDSGELDDSVVKVWIVTPDDELCPICEPLAGISTEIGEDFEESEGPPAHPNCRCATGVRRRSKVAEGRRAVEKLLRKRDK